MIQTMRLNKLFIATLLALSTLAFQSCLKDQEDIFDESSSTRLQATLDNAKAVLTSAPNGWLFDYTPDKYQSYGSYIYTLQFDDAQVNVGSEIAPGQFEKSLYKLTNDNGPVLTFDSYNTLMHYFATPWGDSDGYQAMDGDFEFMIMDVTEDLITLQGKRTGNTMYLRRLNEDPATVLNAICAMNDDIYVSAGSGTIGELPITMSIDLSVRSMTIFWGGTEEGSEAFSDEAFYLPTATGIRFVTPITVNGATISELSFNPDGYLFSGTDSNGNQVSITGILPATYSFIEEFSGEFTFAFFFGIYTSNVTLTPDPATGLITMTTPGGFNLVAKYNKSKGCLSLTGQQLYSGSDMNVFFYAGGTGGSFYTSTQAGMDFVKSKSNPKRFVAEANAASPASVNSFYFIATYPGDDSYYLAPAPWRLNNTGQITYVQYLQKK